MSPQDFAYWLKGFMEIENPKELDEKKTQIIKDHLDLVFKKITPDRSLENTFDLPIPSVKPNDIHRHGGGVICCTPNESINGYKLPKGYYC